MRRWGVLRAWVLLLAVALGAVAAEPPPSLVRYDLAESRKSVSPAGERASAVRGGVQVLDGTARWDLESGTFPRTPANTVVLGGRGGWLVDRKAAVAARASLEDLRALFVPPAEGEPGPFQAAVRDVSVPPAVIAPGPAFEGRPTSRLRLTAAWSVVAASPGRVSRIGCRLSAVVVALEEPLSALRSPLDDTERLFDAPEEVREALAPELARLRGFPVSVVVETEAELAVDHPGMEAPPPDGRAPVRTRTETRREVSSLATRPTAPGDAGAFGLSEETRVVGLERLVAPRETLR